MVPKLPVPVSLLLLASVWCASGLPAAEEEPTLVLEAEQLGPPKTRYVDQWASGSACVAASLSVGEGTLLKAATEEEPKPGFYRVRFYLRLSTLENAVNTGLFVGMECGGAGRRVWQGNFLPPESYTAFDLLVDHPADAAMRFAVTWGQVGQFFGKAYNKEVAGEVKAGDAKLDLRAAPGAGETGEGLDADEDDVALIELAGGQDLSDLTPPYVALDRIEVTPIQQVARTFQIWPSKIRYGPGESGTAEIRIRNYRTNRQVLQAKVSLVRDLDERRVVWEGEVELPPSGVLKKEVPFTVGPEHFGRALAVELLQDGKIVDTADEPFGVARHSYEISIWGLGPGAFHWDLPEDRMRPIIHQNRLRYANVYEFFSWAPCDFYELSPDYDKWYSGQTQYQCHKQVIQRFHELCHEHGIQAASYYQNQAKPPPGLEALQLYPDWFGRDEVGIAFSHVDVQALERMVRGEYRSEKGDLNAYMPMWTRTHLEDVVRHGGHEQVRSAKMFGWDCTRYDGHFFAYGEDGDALTAHHDQLVRSIVWKEVPSYAFGYNAGNGMDRMVEGPYDRPDLLNFVQMCSGGGLIMNEAFRDHPNRNFSAALIEEYVKWVNDEARATRRAGGYHLGFFFDTASPADHAYNCAIELASGSRPLGYSDGIAADWPRFVTRYSAYYLDNDLFEILDAARRVSVRSPAPIWYERFCYRRPLGKGRGQYLVHLISKPRYRRYNDLLQPPAPVMKDVVVSVVPDEGWKITSAWALTPVYPERTGPIAVRQKGRGFEAVLPDLTLFASVVLNAEGPADRELPVQRLPESKADNPLWALHEKIEALREQGYLAPADEERRKKETESIRKVLEGRSNPSPKLKTELLPDEFRKAAALKEAPRPKDFARPRDLKLRRNRLLDIRIARGPYNWLMRLDEALGRAGGADVSSGFLKVNAPWADPIGKVTDNPWTYEDLLGTDVVVFNNLGAIHIDQQTQIRLRDFVEQGGGLLVLGGYWTLGRGGFRESVLEEVLPVNLSVGGDREEIIPLEGGVSALEATAQAPEAARGLAWQVRPSVHYVHRVEAKPDAEVWARAGQRPMLIAGKFGKGRVIVWAGTIHGRFAEGETPFWQWHDWPKLLAEALSVLGEGHEQFYQPESEVVTEDAAVSALEELMGLEPGEQKERIAELCKKADAGAAAQLITLAGDELPLTEAQIVSLVDRIRPGTEDLVGAARRFLTSQQPPLLAAGVRLLGLSGDKALETEIIEYLDSPFVEVQTGAVLAIAAIGSPRSLTALAEKTKQAEKLDLTDEQNRKFYHRVLIARRRLGDATVAGKLAAATLHSFGEAERQYREWSSLMEQAGTAFKLTPRAYARWQMKMRRALDARARWIKEYEYLAAELSQLPKEAGPSLAVSLADATDYPALGLVHRVMARAGPETIRGLLPLLGARMIAIAGAVARRAHDSPELRKALANELVRLSRSPEARHRKFTALHADYLEGPQQRESLNRLIADPVKEISVAAKQAMEALE